MDLIDVLEKIVEPTYACLLPGRFASPEATVLLLAIGLQESGFATRTQRGGPARGFWQFEQRGGVKGVLNHAASRLTVRSVCLHRAVAPTESDVYMAIGHDDMLACAVARLLLWTDPAKLPAIGDAPAAWAMYERNWRPGKPHPDAWGEHYALAKRALA